MDETKLEFPSKGEGKWVEVEAPDRDRSMKYNMEFKWQAILPLAVADAVWPDVARTAVQGLGFTKAICSTAKSQLEYKPGIKPEEMTVCLMIMTGETEPDAFALRNALENLKKLCDLPDVNFTLKRGKIKCGVLQGNEAPEVISFWPIFHDENAKSIPTAGITYSQVVDTNQRFDQHEDGMKNMDLLGYNPYAYEIGTTTLGPAAKNVAKKTSIQYMGNGVYVLPTPAHHQMFVPKIASYDPNDKCGPDEFMLEKMLPEKAPEDVAQAYYKDVVCYRSQKMFDTHITMDQQDGVKTFERLMTVSSSVVGTIMGENFFMTPTALEDQKLNRRPFTGNKQAVEWGMLHEPHAEQVWAIWVLAMLMDKARDMKLESKALQVKIIQVGRIQCLDPDLLWMSSSPDRVLCYRFGMFEPWRFRLMEAKCPHKRAMWSKCPWKYDKRFTPKMYELQMQHQAGVWNASCQHPWFQAALRKLADIPEKDPVEWAVKNIDFVIWQPKQAWIIAHTYNPACFQEIKEKCGDFYFNRYMPRCANVFREQGYSTIAEWKALEKGKRKQDLITGTACEEE